MQMLTNIFRKSEWSPSFSYEKSVTEGKKPEANQNNTPRWTFSFTSAQVRFAWKPCALCFWLAKTPMH